MPKFEKLVERLVRKGYEYVRSHSLQLDLPFGRCRLLDMPTLIHSKEIVGRSKDLLVTAQLRAILDAGRTQ
jgi:hypothetical protein